MKKYVQAAREESGSIMILAAFGLLILIAILALSIDHGRNYLTQSDLEAKLTAITKAAGNEYTYWEIRQQVSVAAASMGLEAVPKEDCTVYVLCDSTLTQDQALQKLVTFVQTSLQKTNPGVTIEVPSPIASILKTNSQGQRYLLFTARDAQKKDLANFSGETTPPTVAAQSGVLINTIKNRGGLASQIVFSLDQDSKNQLADGPADQVKQVFDVVDKTITTIGVPTDDLKMGLTLGNLPVRGPVDAGGTLITGGLDCSGSDKLGSSGSCYDNKPGFNGKDIGTIHIANQSRKYTYQGLLASTDAITCKRPVWEYRLAASGTCKEVKTTETYVNPPAALPNCSGPEPTPTPTSAPTPGGPTPTPTPNPTPIPRCDLCNFLLQNSR